MAFLRQCLQDLRATRRDWAPEEMDWSARARASDPRALARVPAAGMGELRLMPARQRRLLVGVNAITHGNLIHGSA